MPPSRMESMWLPRYNRVYQRPASMPRQEQDAVSWYLCLIRANPLGTDEEPGKLPDTLKVHHSLIALQNPWQTYLNLWQAVRSREWSQQLNDLPTVWVRDCPLPD
jgi:hypothetical protein